MTKEKLRLHFKNIINQMDTSQIIKKSNKIVNFLQDHPKIQESKSILVFFPIKYEPDIYPFIEYIWDKNKTVFAPFLKKLEIGEIRSWDDVVDYNYRYRQPRKELFEKQSVEVSISPGLAFDKSNYRLGRGTGWYDIFFAINPQIYKIGVCFKEQLIQKLPRDKHDVPFDEVIAE